MDASTLMPLLYLSLALLPLVIVNWKKGKARFMRAIVMWGILILLLTFVFKAFDGTHFMPRGSDRLHAPESDQPV